jgi:hypothetical protein
MKQELPEMPKLPNIAGIEKRKNRPSKLPDQSWQSLAVAAIFDNSGNSLIGVA